MCYKKVKVVVFHYSIKFTKNLITNPRIFEPYIVYINTNKIIFLNYRYDEYPLLKIYNTLKKYVPYFPQKVEIFKRHNDDGRVLYYNIDTKNMKNYYSEHLLTNSHDLKIFYNYTSESKSIITFT